MSGTTNYKVTFKFDRDRDNGSRKEYGMAVLTVSGGATYTIGGTSASSKEYIEFTVSNGQRLTTSINGLTQGFKFKKWYADGVNIQQGQDELENLSITVNGSDVTIIPSFEPDGVTFGTKITTTVSGLDGIVPSGVTPIIVSSMQDYYHYVINGNGERHFNMDDPASDILPDGKTITLQAVNIPGYSITVTRNGVLVNNSDTSQSSLSGDAGSGRGSVGEYEPSKGYAYTTYDIDNSASATGNLAISVTYTPETPKGTVYIKASPSNCGDVAIPSIHADHYTGDYGEQVSISATPANGYEISHWQYSLSDGTGVQEGDWVETEMTSSTINVTIENPVKCYRVLFKNIPSISPKIYVNSAQGGRVKIYEIVDGSEIEVQSPMDRDLYSIDTQFKLVAQANQGFVFDKWSNVGGSEITPQDATNDVITIGFEQTEVTYTAHFRSNIYSSVNLYTSVIEDGQTVLGANGESLVPDFKVVYTGIDGTETESYAGSCRQGVAPVNIRSLVVEDTSVLRISASKTVTVTDSDGRVYKYTAANENNLGCVSWSVNNCPPGSVYDSSQWTTVPGQLEGETIVTEVSIPVEHSTTHSSEKTLSVFYDRVEMFEVKLSVKVRNHRYGSNAAREIIVSGGGWFEKGDSTTINTSLNLGVDQQKYVFIGWFNEGDDTSGSPEQGYDTQSMTIDDIEDNQSLIAVYEEYCNITYRADPSNLSSGMTAVDVVSQDTIASDSWILYGTRVTITVTPVQGASVSSWTGVSGYAYGATSVTLTISQQTTAVVNLMETYNTLTVNTGDGGYVQIYEATPGGSYNLLEPDVAERNEYHIPSGSGFRSVAVTEPRYRFYKFRVFNSGGSVVAETSATTYTQNQMSGDMSIEATFTYFNWINTISQIIKVF